MSMWSDILPLRGKASSEEAPHLAAGARAEALAEQHLQSHGLTTRARNYRCPPGEIDLIMNDKGQLVFVEVRYRKRASHGSPAESVTPQKQRKLQRAAQHYLQTKRLTERVSCRFDVVSVLHAKGEPRIDWIPNAF